MSRKKLVPVAVAAGLLCWGVSYAQSGDGGDIDTLLFGQEAEGNESEKASGLSDNDQPETIPVTEESDFGDAYEAPKPVRRKSRFIEEIVVTAQKREENLQDVPISVSAFSAEALEAKGINDPRDLQLVTPGLSYTSLANYSIIYLRGIGTDAFIPSADGSVATYIDGIYFPFAVGLAQSFGALERVEVLKGPQGTLFGRNSTGGALNITTKKPSFDEFLGSAEVGYARFNDLKTRAYVNVPLGDDFAFSVSGLYNKSDNYYKSLNNELPSEISRGGRVKLRWAPGDNLDLTLAALKIQSSGAGTSLAAQIAPKPLVRVLGQQAPPPYETDADYAASNDTNTEVIYGDGTWNLPWFDMRLLLANQEIHALEGLDFDATALPLVSFEHPNAFSEIQTAELQLISNSDSWGSDWLTYIGGLYYIRSDAGYDPVDLFVAVEDISSVPVVGPVLGPILDPLLGGILDPLLPVSVRIRGILHTNSSAAFFQTTSKFTDWLSLTVGGRYQTETRELTKATVALYEFDQPIISYAPRSKDTSNFSPKVSIDVRPTDGILTYLSYTKGFKSGTYNIITIYTQPGYVKPEEVSTTELGAKMEFFDGSLRLNGAIFQNDIKNVQVQVISLVSGGAVAFENAGKARIRGAEFDLTWQPFTESLPGLVVSSSATYLDGTYTDFPNGSGYDLTTGLFFGENSLLGPLAPGRDFAGNRIVQTPKFTGTFGLGYTFETKSGPLEVSADIYHNDGFYYTAQNSPNSEQSDYSVVNAHVSYLYEPWNVRLTVFGTNLTDTEYYYYNFETDFGTSALLHPPRAYGLRLKWDF